MLRSGTPGDAGFDAERLGRVIELIDQAVAEGAFPGAVALVARRGVIALHHAAGDAAVEPERVPVAPDTLFDLASLTKPVATTTAILILIERGQLSLGDAVARFLPELGGPAWESVTLKHLLTHTAGLRPWYPLYLDASDPEAAVRFIARLPFVSSPGERVDYSDLGFMLLGEVVRRVSGSPLDVFARDEVFRPLGLEDLGFRPAVDRRRVAATERGNRREADQLARAARSFPGLRQEVVWGEVHDGNAYHVFAGVAGHAGLFGTAFDLAAFAQMYLDAARGEDTPILSVASLRLAASDLTPHLDLGRGLGWRFHRVAGVRPSEPPRRESPEDPFRPPVPSSAVPEPQGDLLSPGAFGHTGFTGTSLWIDPHLELVAVLLTNRVHPDAGNQPIAWIRPRFHNLVVAAMVGPGA